MKFGCCASIDKAAELRAAGFDYMEAAVTSLVPDEDDDAFVSVLKTYQGSPIPIRACNSFLPRDLKIVGPEIDEVRLKRYLSRALPRIEAVGASTAVIGSAGSRSIPDGFPRDEAIKQIVRFMHLVADEAEKSNVTIAIEPLNRKESNVINSVAEGVEIAELVNRPSIKVLADFYHMDEDLEPLNHLVEYGAWLAHIHVADTERLAPGSGQYPYETFVEGLRQAGYDGMVSVECRWQDFAVEAKPAADFLRQAFHNTH